MFIIDFNAGKEEISAAISEPNAPQWATSIYSFVRSWIIEGADSFAVKTSGSTGAPKEIYHSREAMIASAERTCDFFRLKSEDVLLLALPATHIGGKMMIARSIVRRTQLICIEPVSNPLLDLQANNDIEFASFTPMQMTMILSNPVSKAKLAQVHQIILGGGEVPAPLKELLQDIPSSVYETYAMTETLSHIALKKINGKDQSEYFTVLDGVDISTDDRDCLVIKASHLSKEMIITNDIARIINDKQFQWLGRYDNIINTGGIKISAEEVERKIRPYMQTNFFVTGVPDDVFGQRVVLLLESMENRNDIDKSYEQVLDKYEKPKEILIVEKFNYTETGKINKKETLKNMS